ncbi:MAG: SpoIIE family protein phosphatase [Spirochaetales bacterium]|nr:SpoIIE family protein phosphatase [Spirochaetales bacterium]
MTLSGALESENLRLKGLVHAFSQLNTSLDLEAVLLNTLQTATGLMSAEIGSIALIDEKSRTLSFVESTDPNFQKLKEMRIPVGEGIAGNVALTGVPVRVADVRQDSRFYAMIDEKMGQKTSSYMCVPLKVNNKITGTMQIMNRIDGQSFGPEDEELMLRFADQAALAIHNARLHRIQLEQKAIESELRVCAEIQAKLFPEAMPALPGYELFGTSEPNRQVGGDYYNFCRRADQSCDVIIADVSGKGLAAALMVSELHTGVHLLGQLDRPLHESISILNSHLHESLITGKFITLFAARIHPDRHEIDYVLAGHPPPILIAPDGSRRELQRTGPVLGIGPFVFQAAKTELSPGEVLVAFSDGYSEASNPDGGFFEEDGIYETVLGVRKEPLDIVGETLKKRCLEFCRGQPTADDMTLLLIRRQ